jgi:hypothetical protein
MKTFLSMMIAVALAFVITLAVPLAAGVQAQQVRDQGPATAKGGTAVLSGTVVTDEQTPQPVRRAMVTATNTEGNVTRTAYTDEAGRFSLATLPAGRYTLVANKAPWLRTAYGAKRYDLPGTPITLKDAAQMPGIVLRMSRGAVLSGRITDENGEPAFGVSIRVLQLRTQFGERSFVPATGSGSNFETTDDRGMYRVFGLPPGEYAVSASPRVAPGEVKAMTETEIRAIMNALQQQQQAAQQSAQQQYGQVGAARPTTPPPATAQQAPPPDPNKMTVAYAPVYYPGTTLASSATTVTLAAGEERSGVDFPLRLVRTTTVEGTVVLPAGVLPQMVQLTMMPTSPMPGAGSVGLEMLAIQRATVQADGRFQYTAVPPGSYTISARASRTVGGPGPPPPPPPPPPPGAAGAGQMMTFTTRAVSVGGDMAGMPPGEFQMVMGGDGGAQYWAQTDVPVDGTPIGGVTLPLQPGMTISGKVEFRSSMVRPGAPYKTITLTLRPAPSAGGARVSLGIPTAVIDETGHFKISGVTPGKYVITGLVPTPPGSGPAPPWRVGSAVFKGREVLDFPFEVLPNEDIAEAVVTFIDATQEIAGSLQDASGRPAPDYTIVVFAADKSFWTLNSRRVRTARPGTDGRFTVTGLPPGDYRMAAVVDVSPAEINDPAFLEQIGSASFAITLGPGEKKTQDLKIAGGL